MAVHSPNSFSFDIPTESTYISTDFSAAARKEREKSPAPKSESRRSTASSISIPRRDSSFSNSSTEDNKERSFHSLAHNPYANYEVNDRNIRFKSVKPEQYIPSAEDQSSSFNISRPDSPISFINQDKGVTIERTQHQINQQCQDYVQKNALTLNWKNMIAEKLEPLFNKLSKDMRNGNKRIIKICDNMSLLGEAIQISAAIRHIYPTSNTQLYDNIKNNIDRMSKIIDSIIDINSVEEKDRITEDQFDTMFGEIESSLNESIKSYSEIGKIIADIAHPSEFSVHLPNNYQIDSHASDTCITVTKMMFNDLIPKKLQPTLNKAKATVGKVMTAKATGAKKGGVKQENNETKAKVNPAASRKKSASVSSTVSTSSTNLPNIHIDDAFDIPSAQKTEMLSEIQIILQKYGLKSLRGLFIYPENKTTSVM